MTKSSYKLDLDNIRCFLFGKLEVERFDEDNRYEIIEKNNFLILDGYKSQSLGKKTGLARYEICKCLFAETDILKKIDERIYAIDNKGFENKQYTKDQTDYIRDIFTRKNKSGHIEFIEEISKCLTTKPDLMEQMNCNIKNILKAYDSSSVDRKMLEFIDSIYHAEIDRGDIEKNGYRSSVPYLLAITRQRLVTNISGIHSKEVTEKLLTNLILIALLRDRYPLSIMHNASMPLYSKRQMGFITAIWNCIQINLTALDQEISAQETFMNNILSLQADVLYSDADDINKLIGTVEGYAQRCRIDIKKSFHLLDWTDLLEICNNEDIQLSKRMINFLHKMPMHMVEFAEDEIRQIMEYVKISRFEDYKDHGRISDMIHALLKCLLHIKRLTCLYLALFHTEIPQKIDEDIDDFYNCFAWDSEKANIFVYTIDDKNFLINEIDINTKRFYQSVCAIHNGVNGNFSIILPRIFRTKDFSNIIEIPAHQMPDVISPKNDVDLGYAIIDALHACYKKIHSIYSVQRKTLDILNNITLSSCGKCSMDVDSIKKAISDQLIVFNKLISRPKYIFNNTFVDYMIDKDIRYVEIQSAINFETSNLIDYCESLRLISDCLPENASKKETFLIHMRFAMDKHQSAVEYTIRTIMYLSTWCNHNEKTYFIDTFSDLPYFQTTPENHLPTTKQEAESIISEFLDLEEFRIYDYETEQHEAYVELLKQYNQLRNINNI